MRSVVCSWKNIKFTPKIGIVRKIFTILVTFFVLFSCAKNPQPQEEQIIKVSAVVIDKSGYNLSINECVQLTATVIPQDAVYELVWSSSSESIAIVDQTGLVTPVSVGVADICAEAGGIISSCRVTVVKPEFMDYIDEYGINYGKGVKIDDIVWAPVNCGYHETDYQYGKLYQWGRKYGQGYEGDFWNADTILTYSDTYPPTVAEGPVSSSVGNDPANADIYFTGKFNFRNDWTDPQDAKLWNSGSQESPLKTENDPCPEGWRVPTYIELEALSANYSAWTKENGQNGFWFTGSAAYSSESHQIFLSAGGQIDYEGRASDRGRYGNYWSSRPTRAPESYFANAMFFYSDTINMTYYFGRAAAFSVRCVQE